MVIPQPTAVEPDPIVRRGLKRASDGGNMGIVEICSLISDVNVNEEPHPQIPVMEFSEEERQALWAELARLDEFEAKKDISRDQDIGPLLTFIWVLTVKNGAPNYRLCLRLFWSAIRKEQGVSSLSDSWTTDLQNVACSGCSIRFECECFDVNKAFMHTHPSRLLAA